MMRLAVRLDRAWLKMRPRLEAAYERILDWVLDRVGRL